MKASPASTPPRPPEGPAPAASWLDRMLRHVDSLHQREVEAYLASSTDVFEVERRLRDLERSYCSLGIAR